MLDGINRHGCLRFFKSSFLFLPFSMELEDLGPQLFVSGARSFLVRFLLRSLGLQLFVFRLPLRPEFHDMVRYDCLVNFAVDWIGAALKNFFEYFVFLDRLQPLVVF